MKSFSTYQYLSGEPMNDRDKIEVGSKYWNEGKWKSCVLPLLPDDCSELTFVDMGCNAGLFLKLAEDKGFKRIVGIDSDKEAVKRGIKWKEQQGGSYTLIHATMQDGIEKIPVSDYMTFVNSHYYFKKQEWEEFIQKIREKTCHCILVTAKKQPSDEYAASDIESIRQYFKDWSEVGYEELVPDGTPHSRHLMSICFKNPDLERVPIDSLDNGNAQQRNFLEEIDQGMSPEKTMYYKRLKSYRARKTSKQQTWSEKN